MEGEMVAGAFGALGIMGETSLTKKKEHIMQQDQE